MAVSLSKLALAVYELDSVHGLLREGEAVTPDALLAAVQSYKTTKHKDSYIVDGATVKSLELLLIAGANPNWRCPEATEDSASIVNVSPELEFWPSRREYHPLYWAGIAPHLGRDTKPWKDHLNALQLTLLRHGADVFARFRQPTADPRPYLGFPRVEISPNTDKKHAQIMFDLKDRIWLSKYSLQQKREQEDLMWTYEDRMDKEMERLGKSFNLNEFKVLFEDDFGPLDESPPDPSTVFGSFGTRCLIHALLEDGGFVQPILASNFDFEHRDPQGRTVFLSACRSILGADAAVDGIIEDIHWDTETAGYYFNPFPQADHLISSPPARTTQIRTTIFQACIQKGINAVAVDNYGKHALFHLLEAYDHRNPSRPPVIRQSVQFLIKNHPQLVNQPDNAGNYPIHASLQRLRKYPDRNKYTDAAELEAVVNDLLHAGANPRVRDERGNSILDYVSDANLVDECRIQEQERLYSAFVLLV